MFYVKLLNHVHMKWRFFLTKFVNYESISWKQCDEYPVDTQEPVIAHLVFNFTSKVIENGGVTHNFESGPPKDHFNSNFWAKDFDVIFIS
jgi:hypothetical protein